MTYKGSWRRRFDAALLAATVVAGSAAALHAQTAGPRAGDPLQAAAAALGVGALDTLEVTGSGADYLFGQAYAGTLPWPRFDVPSYAIRIDYRVPAFREERTRVQGANPPQGGGNQPIRDQRQIWSVSGPVAWNGDGANASPAGQERDQRESDVARRTQVWMTPHGFIKGALAAKASVQPAERNGRRITIVRYDTPDGVPLEGTLDANGLVEHVETWVGTPVLGDVALETQFSNYEAFGAIRFPRRVVHREAGYPVLTLDVTGVVVNPPGRIEVPASLATRRAAAAEAKATPQRIADGVWSIPLGPRDRSVAIEFADSVIVVEAPDSEEMSLRALEALRTVVPGKPVTHLVNTHIHFDHSGGLRTYAAEGATIVTHADNVAYYQEVWANGPRRLSADRLSRSGRQPRFEGIVGSRTFGDGPRRAVVYHYAGNQHHPGMLMVYLPAERIVIEADSFNPPNTPGQEPNAVPNLVQFHEVVQRLALDVEKVVPLHGRITTWDELVGAVETFGRKPAQPAGQRSLR